VPRRHGVVHGGAATWKSCGAMEEPRLGGDVEASSWRALEEPWCAMHEDDIVLARCLTYAFASAARCSRGAVAKTFRCFGDVRIRTGAVVL
jgi:hypothetical protein